MSTNSPNTAPVPGPNIPQPPNYKSWSPEKLLARITDLESQLANLSHNAPPAIATPPPNAATVNTNTTTNNPSNTLSKPTPPKLAKPFNPSKYHTRLIALKFSYLGAGYNGYEHHVGNKTPLPSVEEEIWKALIKTRLVSSRRADELLAVSDGVAMAGRGKGEAGAGKSRRWAFLDGLRGGDVPVDWEGCDYSKCGRTDRGVSAFGQVIGVRIRSARVRKESTVKDTSATTSQDEASDTTKTEDDTRAELPPTEEEAPDFDAIGDELPYISLLNKVLPSTIRILAWCPNPPPNFSARFSCKERLYRYFFTNPAFLSAPGTDNNSSDSPKDGYLDISAMREAAGYLQGLHDFRNLCKIDPTKQLDNFMRRISHASIDSVQEGNGILPSHFGGSSSQTQTGLYTFTVRGSAFLWHQVRCMVGILFLVGQGLENPTIVKQLLDVKKEPCKPHYEMASDAPLVLWDCTFSKNSGVYERGEERPEDHWDRGQGLDELEWVYAGAENESVGNKSLAGWRKYDRAGLMEDLWRGWRAAKMNEVLSSQLFDLVANSGPQGGHVSREDEATAKAMGAAERNVRVFSGDDVAPSKGKYVPLMKRERMDTVEVQNERWLARRPAKAKYFSRFDKPENNLEEPPTPSS